MRFSSSKYLSQKFGLFFFIAVVSGAIASSGYAQVRADDDQHEWMREVDDGIYLVGQRNKYANVGDCTSFAVSPDGRTIVFATYRGLVVWDQEKNKVEEIIKLDDPSCYHVEYSPDGRKLVAVCLRQNAQPPVDGQPLVVDMKLVVELVNGITFEKESTCEIENPEKSPNYYPYPYAVGFSPDGDTLAITSQRFASIIDANSGELISTAKVRTPSQSLCFTADGSQLLLGQGRLSAYDVGTGEKAKESNCKLIGENAQFVEANHDKNVMAISDQTNFSVFDSSTGKEIPLKDKPSSISIQKLALSDNGKKVAIQTWRLKKKQQYVSTIMVWDLDSGELVKEFKGSGVYYQKIRFSADGTKMFGCVSGLPGLAEFSLKDETDGLVGVKKEKKQDAFEEPLSAPAIGIAFSNDGKMFAASTTGQKLRVFRLKDGKISLSLDGIASMRMHFAKNDKRVLSVGSAYNMTTQNRLAMEIDVESGETKNEFNSSAPTRTIRVTGLFKSLMNGGATAPSSPVYPMMPAGGKYSADGEQVFALGHRHSQGMWFARYNAKTGKRLHQKKLTTPQNFQVYQQNAAISNSGLLIATGGARKIYVLDSDSGEIVTELETTGQMMISATFSPNDQYVAVGGMSGFQVWDIESGEIVVDELKQQGSSIKSVAFSRNGKKLLVVPGGKKQPVKVFDAETWELDFERKPETESEVTAAAISPDGKQIVLGLKDCRYEIWKLAEMKR